LEFRQHFTALVTGATGFIGAALTERLVKEGWKTWVLLREKSNTERISHILDSVTPIHCDLSTTTSSRLATKIPEVDVIFHLASEGVSSDYKPLDDLYSVNVLGTQNILRASKEVQVGRFVHVGSCFEYGGGSRIQEDHSLIPTTDYAITKAEASRFVLDFSSQYGYPATVIRPFMIYGPGEASNRLVPDTIKKAMHNETLIYTSGEQIRDFVFIDDAVDAMMKISISDLAIGETLNICSGTGVRIKDVVKLILRCIQSESIPNFGVLPYRKKEEMCIVGDPSKLVDVFGWRCTTSLEEGIKMSIESFHQLDN